VAGNCDDGGHLGVTFAVRGKDLDLVAVVGQALDFGVRSGGFTLSEGAEKWDLKFKTSCKKIVIWPVNN
jgi:hypothetical protein